jgi:protein involved in polysaccharide export with SLBB domain
VPARSYRVASLVVSWLLVLASATASAQATDDSRLPPLITPPETATPATGSADATGSVTATPVPQPVTSEATATEDAAAEPELRIGPRNTLLIRYEATELEPERKATLDYLLGKQVFEVDATGTLSLPVIGRIELLGLTGKEAAERLRAEPLLRDVEIDVAILPLAAQGVEALTGFGYDLFTASSGFLASQAVPDDYVVGPGDVIEVQLFGKETGTHTLTVGSDGMLAVPEIGAVSVAGLTFAELKREIQQRIAARNIGVTAYVSMGSLRGISVFVLGEVAQPGAVTVNALAPVTSALLAAGGVTPTGSLRNIELQRAGSQALRFDLYDLVMRGERSGDRRLKDGDLIFVPPRGPTAGVVGAVQRPAIYEFRAIEQSDVGDLLRFAGGLLPDANLKAATLQRVQDSRRIVLNTDLSHPAALDMPLAAGDILVVPTLTPEVSAKVTVRGHLRNTGVYAWRPGLRVSDLFAGGLMPLPETDLDYAIVVRRTNGRTRVLDFELRDAMRADAPAGEQVALKEGDELVAFRVDATAERQAYLQPLLDRLRQEARQDSPAAIVSINGAVRAPGEYPLAAGMRISDLVRAAGQLAETAYLAEAELTHYAKGTGAMRVEHRTVDLAAALAGNEQHDLLLSERDHLTVKPVPGWSAPASVEIYGEVRFPTTYRIAPGEKLSSLLTRAGGLTERAHANGSVFLRSELRRVEQQHLTQLIQRLEAALAAQTLNRLSNPEQDEAIATGAQLVAQLKTIEPQGRLVINLPGLVADMQAGRASEHDVTLRAGDVLYIPPVIEEVMVLGEVYHPTSHLWVEGRSRNDYIQMSGGLTERSDGKRIFVIRADGTVLSSDRLGSRSELEPGDAIVVPLDVDRLRPLELWSTVARIFFDVGVTVAQLERAFGGNTLIVR